MPNEVLGLGKNALLGAILCGGASTRMGVDKATLLLSGTALWQRVAQRLEPQVEQVIISAAATHDSSHFAPYPCITDKKINPGPLPAIALLLQAPCWRHHDWWIFSSCDTPLQPSDWVELLVNSAAGRPGIYFIRSNRQEHYLHALWHRTMLDSLLEFIHAGGSAVRAFYNLTDAHAVEYPVADGQTYDPFYNINTPEQLALIHV